MIKKVRKLVLVTSDGHPQHKYFAGIAEELSKKLGVSVDIRRDDYVFLSNYGETDDLGLTWLPQLMAEVEGGEVIKVLTQPALTPDGKLDIDGGLKQALRNLGINDE